MLIQAQKSVSGVWETACDFVVEQKNKGVALVTLASAQAFAAVPADVTTAMGDMKTDGIAVATAFLVASIVIMAFLFMRKGAKA